MCIRKSFAARTHLPGTHKTTNYRNAFEFLTHPGKTLWVNHLRTGAHGCPKNDPLPRRPTNCQCSETCKRTKYVAGTSSGAAADKLPSENTTGHVFQAAADRTISEHTSPSSGPVPIGRSARPSNADPLLCLLGYLGPGGRPRPCFRNSSRGARRLFCTLASSFVAPIMHSK